MIDLDIDVLVAVAKVFSEQIDAARIFRVGLDPAELLGTADAGQWLGNDQARFLQRLDVKRGGGHWDLKSRGNFADVYDLAVQNLKMFRRCCEEGALAMVSTCCVIKEQTEQTL